VFLVSRFAAMVSACRSGVVPAVLHQVNNPIGDTLASDLGGKPRSSPSEQMTKLTSHILIVDDHPLFRAGLSFMLQATPDLEVVAAVGTAQEAKELAAHVAIDLATVDVLMPTTSGLTLCDELYELQPTCKVLMLSAISEPQLIADLFRHHACGFAIKSQTPAEIVDAIYQVLGGASRDRGRIRNRRWSTTRASDATRARGFRARHSRQFE
jgi:DNA-binding NarL/FixJ family response regulator